MSGLRGVGLVAVLVLGSGSLVACGGPEQASDARTSGPTALRGDGAPAGQVASPPLAIGERLPEVTSTSGSVIVSLVSRKPGHPDGSAVWRLDRATNRWSPLPALPPGFRAITGLAIADVPYFVGQTCQAVPAADHGEDCTSVDLFRLVDGASRWERLTAPRRLFDDANELGAAGVVGEDGIALSSNSPPFDDFAVLNTSDGSWRTIASPPAVTDRFVDTCATAGTLYLRSLLAGPGTAPSGPEPLRVRHLGAGRRPLDRTGADRPGPGRGGP